MHGTSKKILVTGGAGYIGSHTVTALAQAGFQPIIIDNFSNSRKIVLEGIAKIIGYTPVLYNADCNDLNALLEIADQEESLAGVIHFASLKSVSESVSQPLKYYRENIQSIISILEMMKRKNIYNLVFSSTCAVYGDPQVFPVDEGTPLSPKSPYGNTKKINEEIICDYSMAGAHLNAVILRYFNPIGAHKSVSIGEFPMGSPTNVVPLILQTAAGLRKSFSVYGNDYNTPDGTCIRDYVDIMDLASAHVRSIKWIADKSTYGCDIFNIGAGKGYTVLQLVDIFEKVTGIKFPYQFVGRREGDIEKMYANSDKAKDILGWHSKVQIQESIRNAWQWQLKLKAGKF